MLKLGVNIDHVATVRQARYRGGEDGGRAEPDPVAAALACEAAGAHGITAHLREDRRHIVDRDILRLREAIGTRLNLEMANAAPILELALQVRPDIVCIVPERRAELTTEGGLDAVAGEAALTTSRRRLNDAGVEVSLFLDPDPAQVSAAARIGAQFIELHTGAYAEAFGEPPRRAAELGRLRAAAVQAQELGLQVNAGHGLTCANLPPLWTVPGMVELNIGHSLVSRALFVGLPTAVREFLAVMDGYGG